MQRIKITGMTAETAERERGMGNHLKGQSSPYLLQHSENPVDWYPWGDEAFEKAAQEDKPVFLSIGYSTCHWCHVMERESFENADIAEILNRNFVSIKVDREERPDIDSVYMSVCQALTGSGGWPMSIFLTPEQKPFFAGTYFPPESRYGMTGFQDVLLLIADKWKSGRDELTESAGHILAHVGAGTDKAEGIVDCFLPERAVRIFTESFDETYGGFGSAPKFPTPHNLLFLTLYAQIHRDESVFSQVKKTLEQMRRGGIFDHIGFGFSRYSTDRYYLVPHFEKMLYDNALLILAYGAAYKASGDGLFLDTAEKTAAYVLREMTGAEGEFYSAQDADSEGEEGKFYVWDHEEICQILGEKRGRKFCRYFGMTRKGNFEGKNIPNLLNGNEAADDFGEEKETLYAHRKSRFRLHLDDKILTSWNSLMIGALSVLYCATGNAGYLSAAKTAQQFIEKNLAEGNLLFVSCRNHVRSGKGFLDEYAYYTAALLHLYEASGEAVYLERAKQICGEAGRQFADESRGGYFLCGTENDTLILKPKETYDGALPSGNSVMAYCLVRLSQITGEEEYRRLAERQLAFLSGEAGQYPAGHGMFLLALLMHLHPMQKITVAAAQEDRKPEQGWKGRIRKELPLYAEVRILPEETEGYRLLNGKTTYYVCKEHVCLPPSNEAP